MQNGYKDGLKHWRSLKFKARFGEHWAAVDGLIGPITAADHLRSDSPKSIFKIIVQVRLYVSSL